LKDNVPEPTNVIVNHQYDVILLKVLVDEE